MTAFLLTWNPKEWSHENLLEVVERFDRDGVVETLWRVSANKQAKAGDRAFLLKQGAGHCGIFGAGTLLDAPRFRPDPSDPEKSRKRSMVRFDLLSDPLKLILIPTSNLKGVIEDSFIKAASSGMSALPADGEEWIVRALEVRSAAAVEAQVRTGKPTTGPVPTAWTGSVTRTVATAAQTYAFRLGKRSVWKIGHAQDVAGRLADVNRHIPFEEIDEQWNHFYHQKWDSSELAYEMEQAVLKALTNFRTDGERVRCSTEQLEAAWNDTCIAVTRSSKPGRY